VFKTKRAKKSCMALAAVLVLKVEIPLTPQARGWMCTSLWILLGSLTLSDKGCLLALSQVLRY